MTDVINALKVIGFGDPQAGMFDWLMDFALKGFLILACAACLSLALRNASASARGIMWLIAIVAVLILPAMTLIVPTWRVPSAGAEKALAFVRDAGPDVISATNAPIFIGQTSPMIAGMAEKADPTAAFVPTFPFQSWLFIGWVTGTFILLLRLGAGWLGISILGWRSARVSQGPQHEALEKQKLKLGVKRQVILLNSRKRSMPMTWGTFRPRILLPADSVEWNREQLHTVLLHELAHVKRADCLALLVTQLACAVHWFNPLVWLASWRLSIENERATDDLVLQSGVLPPDYAEVLLQSSASVPRTFLPNIAAVAMARPKGLEQRLVTVLDASRNRNRPGAAVILTAMIAASVLLLPLAMLRADDEKEDANDTAKPGESTPTRTPVEVELPPELENPVGDNPRFTDQMKQQFEALRLEQEISTLETQLKALSKLDGAAFSEEAQALGIDMGIDSSILGTQLRQHEEAYRNLQALIDSGIGPSHPDRIAAREEIDRTSSALLDRAASAVQASLRAKLNEATVQRSLLAAEARLAEAVSRNAQTSRVRVATPEAGIVGRVDVKPGQLVEKNASLVRLVDTQARGKIELIELQLASAHRLRKLKQEAVSAAEGTLEIMTSQYSEGVTSLSEIAAARKELRTEKGEVLQMDSEIRSAELQRKLAMGELEQLNVRAPLKGKVIEVLCHPGEYVSPTSPVVIIELIEE